MSSIISLYKNIEMNNKEAENIYNKFLKIIEEKLGNNITNNIELTKLGKKIFGRKYIGTYSADKIPKMSNNKYCIVNLDNSNEAGSHWIALVKNHDKVMIYDSFGRKTISILPNLVQSGNGYIVESENDPEQKIIENNCGQRCLSWLLVYDNYGFDVAKMI
jgi:hypothetical protein